MTGVEEAAALAAMSGAAAGGTAATATGLTAAEIAAAMAAANEVTAAGGSIMAAGGAAAPTIAEVGAGAGGLLGSAGSTTAADIAGGATGTAIEGVGTNATPIVGQGTSSAFGPMPGANEFGYQGLSSISSNPANTQFMTGSAGELSSVGGSGQTLASTTADAMMMPAPSSSFSTTDAFRLAQQGYKMANGQEKTQQPGRAPMVPGSPEEMAQRRRNGFGELSPYRNQQNYTPRRYGYNHQRGLLES